ncbi:MAG: hypothetical protein PHF31_01260, partial [Methylobacter sp.]|nr:hypothetical protein [Methylobacter sp.]
MVGAIADAMTLGQIDRKKPSGSGMLKAAIFCHGLSSFIRVSRTMRFVPHRIYGLLHFASFFFSIATVSQRSCCHISGLLMRSLLPLALMDFR